MFITQWEVNSRHCGKQPNCSPIPYRPNFIYHHRNITFLIRHVMSIKRTINNPSWNQIFKVKLSIKALSHQQLTLQLRYLWQTTTMYLTLIITSTQVVETLVTSTYYSPSKDHTHPENQTTLSHKALSVSNVSFHWKIDLEWVCKPLWRRARSFYGSKEENSCTCSGCW